MSNPFVAEIRMFAGSFAPTGWALCDGQLLAISQNTALFALLGTFYGGDGKSTFALPNLEGSLVVGQGQGAGLSDYSIGQSSGVPNVTLIQTEMPFHTHQVRADTLDNPDGSAPTNAALGSNANTAVYSSATSPLTQMNPFSLAIAGASFPHNNMMPYLCLTFIIALQGIFPARG